MRESTDFGESKGGCLGFLPDGLYERLHRLLFDRPPSPEIEEPTSGPPLIPLDSVVADVHDDLDLLMQQGAALFGLEPAGSVVPRDDVHLGVEPLLSTARAAVWWTREVRHAGPFLGIQPTERIVTLSGVTVIDRESGQFLRYFDWAGFFGQLGIVFNTRPNCDPHHPWAPPEHEVVAE